VQQRCLEERRRVEWKEMENGEWFGERNENEYGKEMEGLKRMTA